MFDAEHLAVVYAGLAAFAPWNNVICIHFLKLILDLLSAFGGTNGADSFLALIYQSFCRTVKQAEVEETFIAGPRTMGLRIKKV